MAALIENGDLRFEYRHRVLGNPQSQMAAEAVECAADQNKFWAYHQQLFENQQGGFSVAKLKGLATKIGLNQTAFGQCLDSHQQQQRVVEMTAAAKRLGVDSTPTFSVNGKLLQLDSFDDVRKAVDKELKER